MSDSISFSDDVKKTKRTQWAIIIAVLIVILALFPLIFDSPYLLHILNLAFISILAAVSFRTIIISGQFPLGHAAFMAIGAYSSSMLAKWAGLSPWMTIPLGAVIATCAGILIGYPFSRLRSIYYAMVSLFFGIGIVQLIHAGGTITGGYSGLTGIPPLLGYMKTPYYYLFLVVVTISLLVLYRFENCRVGATWKAIAQSHMIASSVGVNEAFYRVFALAVGCFFAGLAGALYAHYNFTIGTSSFNFMATMNLLMYGVVGGMFSFAGPIVGAAFLVIVPEMARELKQYVPYFSAVILIIVVYGMPKGLMGLPDLFKGIFKKRPQTRAGRIENAH